MKIRTIELQEMLTKVSKGVGNNKLIPLTGMIMIKVENGKLILSSTDSNNYLTVSKSGFEPEEFYAVVNADLFNRLISKFTSEFVELNIEGDVVKVKGNGEYIINLQFDENNNIVKFPEPAKEFMVEESTEIKKAVLDNILLSNKSALAATMEVPVYTAYYMADRVISTDTIKICELKSKVFDKPVLLNRQFVDLLAVIDDEKITLELAGNDIMAVTDYVQVYGHLMPGVEEYQIAAIDSLLNQQFSSGCSVDKNRLIDILDRISLFVDIYDNGAIQLYFGDGGITIQSLKTNGVESLPYLESNVVAPIACLIDVNMLLEQIKSIEGDSLKIEFGSDNAIKLIHDNIVEIIALLQE